MYDPITAVFQLIRGCEGDTSVEQFYDWVHNTVLPCILETGGYLLSETDREDAGAGNLAEMPLPPSGTAFLDMHSRIAAFDDQWGNSVKLEPDSAIDATAYDECFFRRVRALGDHPAVRDLNDRVDSLVLPALFAHPGAMEQLPAILAAAAEPDGGVLDI